MDCVTAVSSPNDCERDIPGAWYDMTDLERRVAEVTGTQYVDPRPWFCVEQFCPGFVGATPVYADGGHLTNAYSEQLGDVMFAALHSAAEAAQEAQEAQGETSRTSEKPEKPETSPGTDSSARSMPGRAAPLPSN